MKFNKVRTGMYRSEDGRYEVERDVYAGMTRAEYQRGLELGYGSDDDGWSATFHEEVLDWFPTKREAVAACERHASRSLFHKHLDSVAARRKEIGI